MSDEMELGARQACDTGDGAEFPAEDAPQRRLPSRGDALSVLWWLDNEAADDRS